MPFCHACHVFAAAFRCIKPRFRGTARIAYAKTFPSQSKQGLCNTKPFVLHRTDPVVPGMTAAEVSAA
jgi:hypothetical protein